jgi:acetyl-CoA decarbonylase/synthase complex subunit gamma
MSFDRLRDVLPKRSAWILVLDTNGINVWCAAGEGTFGTEEIVRRVGETGLERIVSHRTLVVPQLGAPGVSAHEVRARCGFRVEYGPVRAADLPAFLDGCGKASAEMRRVRFDARDRAVLIPVELVGEGKHALLLAAAFALAGGFGPSGYSLAGVRTAGLGASAVVLGSFVGAAVLGPLLLPWLPGRAFSVKGAVLGLLFAAGLAVAGAPGPADSWLGPVPWALIVPALSSFVVMLFTGATTFTSLSGVLREMRLAIPLQIAGVVAGFGLWVAGRFVGGGIPG